jgi:hypothetical protein
MSKIFNILKSKLTNPDKLGDWYYKRVEKCLECPLNSDNKKDLSAKDLAFKVANLGKTHCTLCGCSVVDKAKIETEQCPDSPPKWYSIKPQKQSELKLINLSKDKADLNYDSVNNKYIVEYGQLAKNQNTEVSLFIETSGKVLHGLRTVVGCGCTTTETKALGTGYKVSVKYDSRRIGSFNKGVVIHYMNDSNDRMKTEIRLKGNVNN